MLDLNVGVVNIAALVAPQQSFSLDEASQIVYIRAIP